MRRGLKAAWSKKARADAREPDDEAYGIGRVGRKPRTPYSSGLLVVNPAVAHRTAVELNSGGVGGIVTEEEVISPEGVAEVDGHRFDKTVPLLPID